MEVDDVIYGTLLGDACLVRDRTTFRLDITHGDAQKEYLLWKASVLGRGGGLISRLSGYGTLGHSVRYYDKSVLQPVSDIVLRSGKKTVTDEWLQKLNDRSLSIWYQDDGTWGKYGTKTINGGRNERCVYFHTSGFDPVSVRKLQGWLCDVGLRTTVRTHKKKYEVLYLCHSSTLKLWERVAPYLFLESKIDFLPRPGLTDCRCGFPIERRDVVCLLCLQADALLGGLSRNRLINRFGTSSLSRIAGMKVSRKPLNRYWFPVESFGTERGLPDL